VICQSQDKSFFPFTTNDGLSQNSVTSIAQDSFGFLWIATQDGLNKYDGTHFTSYNAYFNDITQEEFSRLGKIIMDDHNQLWLITSDGFISYFEDTADSIRQVVQIPDASSIIQKSQDQYWVGSYTQGLYLLTFHQDSLSYTNVLPDVTVYQIIEIDKQLILGTNDGVVQYNSLTDEVTKLFEELRGLHISDILHNDDGTILVATYNNGLYVWTKNQSLEKHVLLPENLRIQDIHIDSDGILWIATYDTGLFTISDGDVDHFYYDPPQHQVINYNDILCIYEDQNSNIWLGTDGGGLSFFSKSQKPIYGLSNDDIPLGMAVDVPRAISTDGDDHIWVGTSGNGLTVYDPKSKEARHYSSDQSPPFYIPNDRIVSLEHDGDGHMWIGTQEGGLLNYNLDTRTINQVNIPGKTIWDILAMSNDEILLCTRQDGLIKYNTNTQQWQQYKSTSGSSLRTIIKGKYPDTYFIGTDDGNLLMFNERTESITPLQLEKETGGIKSLHLDDDHLWIGTQREGIIIYRLDQKIERILTEENGLPNTVIYSLLDQEDRNIWASTNQGICQIKKSAVYNGDLDVVNQQLNFQDGLVSNEFNTGAYHQDDKNKLYFGGIDGINWFDPRTILENRQPVGLLLLELIITGDEGRKTISLHNREEVELNFMTRHFQIRYSDLTYIDKENTRFQYRLVDYNEEWVDNEDSRLVSFTNVPPSNYIFELRASNADGIWNTNPVSITVEIIPAFWQTWWFKFLVASLLIFLAWLFVNERIKQIKKTADLKHDIAYSESKALKSQMNPHFLFNSLNAIDNYILSNNPVEASDYLSKFSKLIRQTLDYSELSSITLSQEIEILGLYVKMEQMRFPSKFEFEVSVDPNLNPSKIHLPPLIIQPYVENAIWHGLMHLEDDGELEVRFLKEGDFVVCQIEDNGIGRTSAQEIKSKSATKRKSHGMKITSERLNLLEELQGSGGQVKIVDKYSDLQQSLGTLVIIKLPLQ